MRFMQEVEDKMENIASMRVEEDTIKRVYEVGYLLVPTLLEEDIPVIYGNLKELISSFGGQVISDEMPKMMPLAYPMSKVHQNAKNKYDVAYFGWTKFEMEVEKILEMKKKLQVDSNFLRFLIIKTTRANTIAGRRFSLKNQRRRVSAHTKSKEEAGPINKEEIDKEIDAMVAV